MTLRQSDGSRFRLRTYRHPKEEDSGFTIVGAAMATCAAPSIFEPYRTNRRGIEEKFTDGGTGCNNPTLELHLEADLIWPGRQVGCLVNIGTGSSRVSKVSGAYMSLAKKMADDITDTAKIAYEYKKTHPRVPFFRFTVKHGLEDTDFHKWKDMANVRQRTETYLDEEQPMIDKCVECLGHIANLQERATPQETGV